jgi:hypothetical protein
VVEENIIAVHQTKSRQNSRKQGSWVLLAKNMLLESTRPPVGHAVKKCKEIGIVLHLIRVRVEAEGEG